MSVVELQAPFFGKIEPDKVLEGAKEKLEEVVVIGWQKDGSFYLAASHADISRALLLMEIGKRDAVDRVLEE